MKESFLGIDLCPKCSDWNQMFLVEKGLLSKRYYVGCAECQGITEVSAADAAALLQEASKGPDVYAYTEMWNTFEQALASHEGEVMEKVEKKDLLDIIRLAGKIDAETAETLRRKFPADHVKIVQDVHANCVKANMEIGLIEGAIDDEWEKGAGNG